MPDQEQKSDNKEEKLVPLDTTGPGAEVDLPDDTVKQDEVPAEEVKTEQEPAEETKLEEYSEGVNKRIAKLTRKMREAERREKAALDYAQGAKREVEIMSDKFRTTEEKYDKAFSDKVSQQLKSAQEELANSIETGDAAKQVLANKKIAALSIEEARLAAAEKYRADTKPKTPEEQDHLRYRETPSTLPREQAAKGTPDPKAESWAEKNNWFGSDRAMTFTAFEIHKERDTRIRVDFPHKFDKSDYNSTKTVQTVASATSSAARSIKPGRKTVKLTSSQVAIAKKLNVPLEDYAKQLSMKEV